MTPIAIHQCATLDFVWKDEPLDVAWKDGAKDWVALAAKYNLPEIVGEPYVEAVVKVLGAQAKGLRLLTALQGGEPKVMAIGRRKNLFTFELFQPSQVPIGLFLAESSTQLRESLQTYLSKTNRVALQLEIYQIDSKHFDRLGNAEICVESEYIDASYLDFPNDYEDFFSTLSKNFKANCKKQRNKLDSLGASCQLRVIENTADIDLAIELYSKLELSGWKLQKGTAVSEASGQLDFYRVLFRTYAEKGHAQIVQYWISIEGEDRLVASDLCIVRGETAYMLKTAYDESLSDNESLSSLSPASLMHQDLFKYWIHQRAVKRVEFYGKTMDWHSRWTKQQRSIYHVTLFRSKLAKVVVSQIRSLVQIARRFTKRSL